jgi:hypothetical protein
MLRSEEFSNELTSSHDTLFAHASYRSINCVLFTNLVIASRQDGPGPWKRARWYVETGT